MDQQQNAETRETRFRQLQRMFVDAAAQDVAEMTKLLDVGECFLPDGEGGRRFRKLAHDLRGTGGGYKFPEISDTAAVVEDQYVAGSSAESLRASLSLLCRAVESAKVAVEGDDIS